MGKTWYSRPVLFVQNVERSIEFYTRLLGFEKGPLYEEEGVALVGEVTREDCTLLLNCQQPHKAGHGRMFISLDPEPFRQLRAEFEERGAPVKKGWWGYDLMVVEDPDGNELFFPDPGSSSDSPADADA